MKFSIITPIYNSALFLVDYFQSLEEIWNDKEFEVIIVNDGSTDDFLKVVKQYQENMEMQIILINNIHEGVACARNIGLTEASGDYIFFLDADDWVDIGTFCYMKDLIKKYEAIDMFVFDNKNVDQFLREKIQVRENNYSMGNYIDFLTFHQIGLCVKLYKKKLFEKIRFKEGIYYEDLYLQGDFFQYEDMKILLTNTKLYNYRKNQKSITRSEFTEKKYKDYILCFNFLKEKLPFLLYEFSVLRASRHLLRQAKESKDNKGYLEKLKSYFLVNQINEKNIILRIWLSKRIRSKTKSFLYKLVLKNRIAFLSITYLFNLKDSIGRVKNNDKKN